MEKLIAFWNGHGTKILGALVTFVAAVQVIAPQVHELLPDKGDVWFDLALNFTSALLGLGVIGRGFTNSKAAP